MTLEIISPSEILYKGEVSSVSLPGEMGEFTVLKDHASLISVLKPGRVRYVLTNDEKSIDIKGGIADIDKNVISVCVY